MVGEIGFCGLAWEHCFQGKMHSVLETNNIHKETQEHDLFVAWGLSVQPPVSELKPTSLLFSYLDSPFSFIMFQARLESYESGHMWESLRNKPF